MPDISPARRYYPTLSEIITVDDLPDFLSFVEDELNDLFAQIHYKNLKYSRSINGDAAFYSLDIVSKRSIRFTLPGGLALVLNPDPDNDSHISAFPITLEYQWGIIAFLKTFKLEDFAFSVESFYMLGLKIFKLTDEQVLAHTINNFVVPEDENISKFQQVVDDINIYYGFDSEDPDRLTLPPDTEPSLSVLITAINAHPIIDQAVSVLLFLIYINDTESEQETKDRLRQFYNIMVPEGIEEYIRKIIIPRAKASLEIKTAIEFPRTVLTPWNNDSGSWQRDPNLNVKTLFIFSEAELSVDTATGFGYKLDLGGTLKPARNEIGNTGILLEIDNLKFDLSKTENIAEAISDGRPDDFVGAYARTVAVVLPAKWFGDLDEPAPGLRIAGYDMLIGTGGVSGTFMMETLPYNQDGAPTGYFEQYFTLQYPVTVFSTNENLEVGPITVGTFSELVAFLNAEGLTSTATTFKFPLTVKMVGSNEVKVFNNILDYQKFLGTLPVDNKILWKKIGGNGFRVGFEQFDITFKQNAITSSNIKAKLEIPKLKQGDDPMQISVMGQIQADGDFNLTASFESAITAKFANFVEFKFLTLELGQEDDDFYIGATVELSFPEGIMHEITKGKKIAIPEVRFYSDGTFEIVGGNGFLPVDLHLPLGPVDMSVTGIHFGSIQQKHKGHDRKYNYIGFDGGISVNPFGIDAKGEGIKYYYTTDTDENPAFDDDAFLHIQTIEIDMVIPQKSPVLTIHGMLSIPSPGVSKEYEGSVGFQSSAIGLSGIANMRLMPKYPAFLIDAAIDLPKPIPLGTVSIYGFRGLIGQRYVADKKAIPSLAPDARWYDYYKYPPKGIHISKFSSPEQTGDYTDPFSFGAGIVLGTSADNGFAFSIRAMLLLSVPGVFIADGRTSFLTSRPGLIDNSEPPFYAVVSWTPEALEIVLGADYKLPKSTGAVIKLRAEVDAFFPKKNPSNWHVNFGEKAMNKRNSAIFFKDAIALRLESFVMLSAAGIEAGGWVGYKIKKNFFGIKVDISAYVEVGANISFERTQLGGFISLGGGIKIVVWGLLTINCALSAILAAEAPRPFLIFAELKFKGSIKIGFFRVRFRITLRLRWEFNSSTNVDPIPAIPYQGNSIEALEYVKGTHMLTNESFDLQLVSVSVGSWGQLPVPSTITQTLPLDTYIDIKAAKGLRPNAANISASIGGHTTGAKDYIDLIPPKKVVKGQKVLRQVKHEYAIMSIEIQASSGGAWQQYHPYSALVDLSERPAVNSFKAGYWQRSGNQYNAIRLLANNPLSYLDSGEPGWFIPEQYGMNPSQMYCAVVEDTWHTFNVLNRPVGLEYLAPLQFEGYQINNLYLTLEREYDNSKLDSFHIGQPKNPHNMAKSVVFSNYNKLVITFLEECYFVKLKLATESPSVKINYYAVDEMQQSSQPVFVLVHTEIKTAEELTDEIYFNESEEFDGILRITIEPEIPETDAINDILQQLDTLSTSWYADNSGNVAIGVPDTISGPGSYEDLMTQLLALVPLSCTEGLLCPEPDVSLCTLYNTLLSLNCFGPVENLGHLNMGCYQMFLDIYSDFMNDDANGNYDSLLLDPFREFRDEHKLLHDLYLDLPISTEQQIVDQYQVVWASALNNLQIMLTVGNCNCTSIYEQSCSTSLQQVSWKTVADLEYELTIPGSEAINEDSALMQAAIAKNPQPIWRPDTYYCIRLSLRDTVNSVTNVIYNYQYAFKTAGPIGFFHNAPGVKYGNEYINGTLVNRDSYGELLDPDKYTLTSLRSYIDYKKSYPNADGSLIMSKPVFYGNDECRIVVSFTKPFTYNHLNGWPLYGTLPPLHYELNIMIKDPVLDVLIEYPLPSNQEIIPAPTAPTEEVPLWENQPEPQLTNSILITNNYLTSGQISCHTEPGEPIVPASFYYQVVLTNLKPEKLYTAILHNTLVNGEELTNKEVHRYVFKTSRYENFAAQVNSYKLSTSPVKNAIFNLPEPFTAGQITTGLQIVRNLDTSSSLNTVYPDLFERAIQGIFKIKPVEAALTTEFNMLRNSSGGVIAIWIRNPEPFNNPRLPENLRSKTVTVINSNGTPRAGYYSLISKDCSEALIMRQGTLSGVLRLLFQYSEWDGQQYISRQVPVNLTIS